MSDPDPTSAPDARRRHRTPWLGLIDLPHPRRLEEQQRKLERWIQENRDEHPERLALARSLNSSIDRALREIETALWILDQAIHFKPMEDHGNTPDTPAARTPTLAEHVAIAWDASRPRGAEHANFDTGLTPEFRQRIIAFAAALAAREGVAGEAREELAQIIGETIDVAVQSPAVIHPGLIYGAADRCAALLAERATPAVEPDAGGDARAEALEEAAMVCERAAENGMTNLRLIASAIRERGASPRAPVDEVRARTIEECAKVADAYVASLAPTATLNRSAAHTVAARIRALAATEAPTPPEEETIGICEHCHETKPLRGGLCGRCDFTRRGEPSR